VINALAAPTPGESAGICHFFRGVAAVVYNAVMIRKIPREGRIETGALAADPLGLCNNATLRKAARRLGKLYDAVLAPSGLKATQYGLLVQTQALGNPTMATLASSLLMDLSALRHSLGPLVRDGLVVLRIDPKDRRVKRVVLTPAGRSKFGQASRLWRKAQGRFEQALGPARAAQLRSELKFVTSEAFKDAF
jgi:DNA-binding MarR family transcriptional regulator